MEKSKLFIFLVLALCFSLFVYGCGQTDEGTSVDPGESAVDAQGDSEEEEFTGEPIEWVGATTWNATNVHTKQFEAIIDLIEEKSGGELTISIVGPETWPGNEQLNLVQDGTLDIVRTTTAYYASIMPDGSLAQYAWGNREERKEAGLYQIIDDLVDEHFNAMFLAEHPVGVLHIFLKEPIESTEDLKGDRLRCPPLYSAGAGALGTTAIMMSDGDAVEGLYTGVIEGSITSIATYTDWGYYEIAPYIVSPPLGHATGFVFANRDSFNSLPEHLQQIVLEAVDEANTIADQLWEEEQVRMREIFEEVGVEYIDLPENEWEWYKTIFRDAWLENIVGTELGDERANQIKELLDGLGGPPVSFYTTAWPPSN